MYQYFPYGSDGKESTCNAGDPSLIPGSGRFPEKWNGYPLQYSCLENFMDRGDLWVTVHGVTESDTTERLIFSHFFSPILCLLLWLNNVPYIAAF